MQATVHRFALDTLTGEVLLDSGRVLPFSSVVFEASGLRHLRLGQRLSVTVSGDPEAEGTELTRLWIVGIGDGERIN